MVFIMFFFFKQKTAYEMRISDWSSDVCSSDLGVCSFDDGYFKDISSYNSLMMSSAFYQSFLEYKYILIHQTDAFVFNNELKEWCEKDFDYIGDPWLRNNEIGRASCRERVCQYV